MMTIPDISSDKVELIKNTICKGANDDELQIFLHVCKRTGLDPFTRQIYAVKRWNNALKREEMTIQTGIDGYRLIAERTGKYAPGREPTFQYQDKAILSCTAYIKKQTADGTWHEVAATAFTNEYMQRTKEGKPTQFWQKMGHTMIAKCAEALALRKAFPADLSGIYTKEEMLQAENEIEPEAPQTTITVEPKKKDDPIIVKNHNSAPISDGAIADNQNSEVVSESQAKELEWILSGCVDFFVKTFWEGLSKLDPPFTNFRQLPKVQFDRWKERLISLRELNKKEEI